MNILPLKKSKTLILKFGTSVLTKGSTRLHRPHMLEIVRQCAQLHDDGFRLVIVTSGAVAAGRDYLNNPNLPSTLASKQLLAAVGQSQLIQTWERLFNIFDIHIGQMLLTRADLEDKERFLNARDTLNALLEQRIIPVINENDAVAIRKMKVGDNDNLSALVAILADADQLYLLTDQLGLFDADPRIEPQAKLIPVIDNITDEIRLMAGDSGTTLGTGGMGTKITAADVAARSGIETIIAFGYCHNVIIDLAYGKELGTKFTVNNNLLERRKQWIFAAPVAGVLFIDKGAKNALLEQHKSLLPVGIIKFEGTFSRGEVVIIKTLCGQNLMRGIVRYGSDAITLIQGKKSQQIESILGYEYGPVVMHCDEMITLSS